MLKAQNRAETCLALTRHTRKPGRQRPGSIACGQWDNYRTIFEDFNAVYMFGIQTPAIASRMLALTTSQSVSSNKNGMGSASASSK